MILWPSRKVSGCSARLCTDAERCCTHRRFMFFEFLSLAMFTYFG